MYTYYYRFNVGQLPLWAKKQITESQTNKGNPDQGVDASNPDLPKGRWAQRLPNNAVTFKSHYDTDSIIPFPAQGKFYHYIFYLFLLFVVNKKYDVT